MSKLPLLSGKNAIKIFIKISYQVVRQKGSHLRLHHPNKKPITIPDHKILGKGLLRKLMRDAEIETNEFIKFL